jgi:O-antigen ligase
LSLTPRPFSANNIRDPRSITSPAWVTDSRHSLLVGALAWTLIILLVVPDGFDYSALATSSAPVSGGVVSRAVWMALLGSALVIIAWRSALAWLILRWLNPFLLAFVVLAVGSAMWSIDPVVTLRRTLRLLTVLLVSLAFVLIGWHSHRFQNVVRPVVTSLLIGSLIFGALCPELAIHQEHSRELLGAWRGLTNHKNSLGALSCIGLILWVHAWLAAQAKPALALGGAAISFACLLLSRSSTSLVTSVFVLAFLLLFLRAPRGLHRHMPYMIAAFAALLLVYSLAILRLVPGLDMLLQPIVAMTGKDLSFTGRSDIWSIISAHISLHPYLGTGYGAYWVPSPGSPSVEFLLRMHFYPGSAHNGYLEVANDLGVAGLLCLIGYLVMYLIQCLAVVREDRAQGALFLGLFLQQGITNLSETHWLSVMSVNFAIMTLATTGLARTLLDRRLRQYFGASKQVAPVVQIATVHPGPGGQYAKADRNG